MTATRGLGNLPLTRGFDQAANSLAMTDLRAKPEILCGGFNVKRPAFGFRPAGIDFDADRLAGPCSSSADVVGCDSLRMGDEIAELLAAFCIAGLHRGPRGVVDIDVRPVGHRCDTRTPAGEGSGYDFFDGIGRLASRSVDDGEAECTEVERNPAPEAAQHHFHRGLGS